MLSLSWAKTRRRRYQTQKCDRPFALLAGVFLLALEDVRNK